MAFNLKGFASGLADSGTTYFESMEKERNDAKDAKRSLIFNASSDLYTQARETKKTNDAQVKLDKQYLSTIKSMDPQISKDNQAKLLSLDPTRRLQAEDEFTHRKASNPSVTFGDFMSYVKNPEDLDNTVALDEAYQGSLMAPSKQAEAYYDKSGLLSDDAVDGIYSEVAAVMTEVYGYSPAQAREITKEATYSVQYPPIKIDWSESVALTQHEINNRIQMEAIGSLKIKGATQDLVNANIKTAETTVSAIREMFASNYTVPDVDKDGNAVLDASGNPVMKRAGAQFAALAPTFEQDFKNSREYKKLAVESMTAPIVAMIENPANKKSSMDYLNAAFPGVYGGELDLSYGDGSEVAGTISASKVYFVKGSGPVGGAPKGYVYLGAQILAALKPKEVEVKGAGEVVVPVEDGVESTAVIAAEENLEFAKEMGADDATIKQLESEIVEANSQSAREKRASDREEYKVETNKKKKVSDETFEPAAVRASVWDKNLDLAIEAGNADQVQQVLDWMESTKSSDNSTFKSNLSIRPRMFRRAHAALEDIRIEKNPTLADTLDKIDEVLPGSLLTKPNRISKEQARQFLKDLEKYPAPRDADELEEYNKVKKELYRNI